MIKRTLESILRNIRMPEKRLRFLVVDDEPGWRDLLVYELSSRGYEVETAQNASQGLVALQNGLYDVILADVRMPGEMDGIDMVQRCLEGGAHPKVIFMTGYAAEDKLLNALRYGSSHCLKKPFDLDELFKAISD